MQRLDLRHVVGEHGLQGVAEQHHGGAHATRTPVPRSNEVVKGHGSAAYDLQFPEQAEDSLALQFLQPKLAEGFSPRLGRGGSLLRCHGSLATPGSARIGRSRGLAWVVASQMLFYFPDLPPQLSHPRHGLVELTSHLTHGHDGRVQVPTVVDGHVLDRVLHHPLLFSQSEIRGVVLVQVLEGVSRDGRPLIIKELRPQHVDDAVKRSELLRVLEEVPVDVRPKPLLELLQV
mmetsp:Transcript_1327/g.3631  ORF Transcript_1327/g.3631 Transcript_1327/m.3631 type:complete len:232 (+) Transcript_1327:3633-4328(+)